MSKVNDIIEKGAAIPDDVTAVRDRDDARWKRTARGWYCASEWEEPPADDVSYFSPGHRVGPSANHGPLTVTAVREPEPDPQATVGDVIQHGEPIPANVVRLRDTADDDWHRTATRPLMFSWGGRSVSVGSMRESTRWWPMTVVEVDPEPEPDEAAPQRRLRGCVANWPDAETGAYDPRCCRFPKSCSATVYDEDRVSEGDLEPEPSAQPSVLLDLVRQYGDECYATGEDRDGAALSRAEAASLLFDRIATLVPQQPTAPAVDDEYREWSERQLMDVLAVDQLSDVIPAIEQLREQLRLTQQDRHRDGVRLAEARNDVERLNAEAERVTEALVKAHDEAHATSDPLVLSLPTVPDGAVALIGSRRTYDRDGDRWVIRGSQEPQTRLSLGTVMAFEGSVTVVMREPRTWPKLDGAPDDLRRFKGASGKQYRRHVLPSLDRWYHDADEEGREDWRPLAYWQQVDGPLTEVFEDEPGGEPQ